MQCNLLGRLIQAHVIKAVGDDFGNIDLGDTTLKLPNEELGIGHKTWEFLSEEVRLFGFYSEKDFFQWS